MRHCQIAVLVCLRDIISLNLHVYVNFYVDHEDLSLLHVKVSILDLIEIDHQVLCCVIQCFLYTHTHLFNGPFFRTTWVGRYQKGKTNLDFTEARTVSGSGISWAICKSSPGSRQITTPAPHHSVFCWPDALSAAQPTVSKH